MKTAKTKALLLFLTAAFGALAALPCLSAEQVIIESRKPDGTPNAPLWQEVSGKWNNSKNKSRVAESASMTATNVSVCFTNDPAPAFKVSPGLETNTTYKVEVTFGTSSTYGASPDVEVAIKTDGFSSGALTNTGAFKAPGANRWNLLGEITSSTNQPSITFTYKSGTLSRESRWYTDAIRFSPVAARQD